jgi:hypothetical protein
MGDGSGVVWMMLGIIVLIFLIWLAFFVIRPTSESIKTANNSLEKMGNPFPNKPEVFFPFEPLTELVETCAKKFINSPIPDIPKVFVSPAHYFKNEVKWSQTRRI